MKQSSPIRFVLKEFLFWVNKKIEFLHSFESQIRANQYTMKTHGQILYENEKSINWAQSLVGWYIIESNRIEFQCEFEGRDRKK